MKYRVTATTTETIEVEAESEDAAIDAAWDQPGWEGYHNQLATVTAEPAAEGATA